MVTYLLRTIEAKTKLTLYLTGLGHVNYYLFNERSFIDFQSIVNPIE